MNNHQTIPNMDRAAWLAAMDSRAAHAPVPGYAMYSSLTGGITTDPVLMSVPVDDHLVHRGDGVFETMKCVAGKIYNAEAHLARLERSASGIGLVSRWTRGEWTALIAATLRVADRPDALIRLLLARGPGSMGVNPYDCASPQCYIVVFPLPVPFMRRRPEGAHIGFSRVPPKPPPLADIKHCNYLPNALMAKEARDRGLDFMIGCDGAGHLLEGPTENVAAINQQGELIIYDAPELLLGTTLARLRQLVMPLVADKTLTGVRNWPLARGDLGTAREVWICGTSHDLVAVTRIEGQPVADGRPGPVYALAADLLAADIRA